MRQQKNVSKWLSVLLIIILITFGMFSTLIAPKQTSAAAVVAAPNRSMPFTIANSTAMSTSNTLFPTHSTFGHDVDSVTAIAVGDMDGDGDLDIVVVNDISITATPKQNFVYLNDGKGGFSVIKPFGSSIEVSTSVVLGDIDGDGDLDAVVGNYNEAKDEGQQSAIYINNGAGDLNEVRPFGGSNDKTFSVALGDLNGDGSLDIIAGNYTQPSAVYLNDGHGNFASRSSFGDGTGQTYYVALGDFDGDHFLDIALADARQNSFYLNDRQGHFLNQHNLGSRSDTTYSLAVGDVDNDGDMDIVASNSLKNVIYINNGSGDFPEERQLGVGLDRGLTVTMGDIDSDGDLDVALGNQGQQNILYINDGTGHFSTDDEQLFGTGSDQTNSLAIADIDGNGHLDLVVGNGREPSFIYFNDGTGAIKERKLLGTTEYDTRSVVTGDIDGDGNVDLIVGNDGQPNIIYLNDGKGNYASGGVTCGVTKRTHCFGTGNESTYTLAVGDVDNDRDLDIIVGNMIGQNAVYLNDGSGNFAFGVDNANCANTVQVRCFGSDVSETWNLAIGDIDGNGAIDIVTAAGTSQNTIYLNDRSGHFTDVQHFGPATASGSLSVAISDLNGDGALDIVDGNFDVDSVYLNDGHGVFYNGAAACNTVVSRRCLNDSNSITTSVVVTDLNNDSKPDIVAGNLGQSRIYLNNGQAIFTSGQPFGTGSDDTSAVGVGDIDRDGDVDIVLGLESTGGAGARVHQSVVYINNGGATFYEGAVNCGNTPNVICFGNPTNTQSIAVQDINNDQYADIIAGNGFKQSAAYINNGGTFSGGFNFCGLTDDVRCFGGAPDRSWAIATGDMDGDGDLDLVVGNYAQQSLVYLNDGTGTFLNGEIDCNNSAQIRCFGDELDLTLSVAVGDVDGDGDLDIVTANSEQANFNQPDFVYLNDGTGHLTQSNSFGPNGTASRSIALGDLDSDGDLDIVIGNEDSQSAAYLNDGHGNFPTQHLFGAPAATFSVALGDVDGDGDLDIATGNYLEQNVIYLNNGSGLFVSGSNACQTNTQMRCFGTGTDPTASIAFGDMDGNGTLDLVVGNTGQSVVYTNDGTGNFGSSHDFGIGTSKTGAVAVGDIDGDGDLDIAVGNISVGNIKNNQDTVYINDGTANFSSNRTFGVNDDTRQIAVGDLDGDGDLDLVSVSTNRQSAIYFNKLIRPAALPNNPPSVTTMRPGETHQAAFFSTPVILVNNALLVPYRVADPENDLVNIQAVYSLDGGNNWQSANTITATGEVTNTIRNVLTNCLGGCAYFYTWNTFASGFFGQSDNVVFRILAYPSVKPTKNGVPGPYQRPYASATTFPFRVRGSQVQVLENNAPVSNALIYRLPKGQTDRAQPIAANAAAPPFTTDAQGYLRGRGQIGLGDQLIALEPVSTTNAFSTTYTLYHTNMVPTATGVTGFTVTQPGVQKIDVSATHPLALFPLDISLEWDARNDAKFMTQLQSDLARTSEFLFNASNGQAALGEVRIFQDKQWWDQVNLRIYASNRLRPNAVVGGAITQPITDPVSLQANAPPESALVYGPGQLRMGAVWNRFGNASGNLSEDWPRTLAHELSHYMFFLNDNYVGTDGAGTITSIRSCPGIMSDPYASNSKFHPEADWLPGCAQTLSNRETGRSDWATINAFYPLVAPIVKIDDPSIAGPSNLPLAVTQITTYDPITPTKTLDVPIFYLVNPDGSAYQPSASARGYLFQEDPSDHSGAATRVTALGQASQDQLQARGAKPGDRVCLIEPAVQRSTAVQGCIEVQQGQEKITLTATPNWPPDIVVTPVTSTTLALTVTGAPTGVATKGLLAQLFPGDDLPPTAPVALSQATDGSYHGTITLAQPVAEAQVRVWVNDSVATARLESISNLAIGGNPGAVLTGGGFARTGGGFARTGGGFARTGGGFARTGGGFARTGGAPVSTAEGDVLLVGDNLTFQTGQFLALQTTSAVPKPPSWATVIGNAYRFTASASAPDLSKTSLSFNYLGGDVPAGEEQGVQVYFWDGATWTRLPTTLDMYYHIASARNQGPGLYALMSSVQIALQGPGWNIFADPVAGTRPVAETLASIDGAYTTVYGYTANEKDHPWKVYDVDAPDWVDTLHDLTFGQGYWIHATEAITLYLKGSAGATNTTAAQRATQAESLPTPPATYYGAVPFATSKTGLTVQAKVNDKICGQAQTAQHLIRGQLYEAYSITVSAADAGNNVGCGVPGQPVTLSFLDGTQEITQIRTAWDNSHVIELRPSTIRLPIIRNASGYGPNSDLAASSLEIQPTTPQVGQATEVNVTIRNAGTADITAPFWIDLYIDPRATPQVYQTWPQLADYGISWRVYGLKAGETLTLSSRAPNDPLNPSKNYSNFTTFVRGGAHQLYVLVDSYAPGQQTGAVDESDERDNLFGPINVSVSGSRTIRSTAGARVDTRP